MSKTPTRAGGSRGRTDEMDEVDGMDGMSVPVARAWGIRLAGALARPARLASAALGLGALLICGFVFASRPAVAGPEPLAPEARPLANSVRAVFAPWVDSGKLVGVAVGFVRGEEVGAIYLGLADPAASRPVDAATRFEIASISKTFSGLVLADMIRRGEARANETLGEALGADIPAESRAAGLTLASLASQSSGLVRMPWNFHPADSANPYADYTADRIREFLAKPGFAHDPGAAYLYSNIGFASLGLALEKISGRGFEAFVRARVFGPLGMDATTGATAAPDANDARPHNADGKPDHAWDLPGPMMAVGGVRSTLPDMVLYLRAQMGAAPEGLADAVALAHRPIFHVNDNMDIAMGWHRTRHADLDRVLVWHNGQTGGYHSFIGFWEGERVGLVALSNSARDFDAAAVEALRMALRGAGAGSEAAK